MRGTERIHDKHITQRGHFFGQRLVIGFFAGKKSNILEQHNNARYNIDAVDPVVHEWNVAAQQYGQAIGDWL